jgi:hypothetical protein
MSDSESITMELGVDYDRHLVSDRVDKAIQQVMRDAARQVVAKVALLSNPSVVKLTAREWDGPAGGWKEIDLEAS